VSGPAVALQPGPPQPRPDRVRRWLQAALAALLVGLYLVWWMTYARLHLAPEHYDQRPPGAMATKLGAEFTLTSLTQTTQLPDTFGESHSPSADAVWLVAQLRVTQRSVEPNFNCGLVLAAADGRSWQRDSGLGISRPTDSCLPDDAVVGRSYPIEVDFQVPVSDVGKVVGVAIPQFNAGRDPLLTPPR
jgi:hypothetical protein